MESSAQSETVAMNTNNPELKRKRSPSNEAHHHPAPPPKAAKTHNHLQINYLARQYYEDLPLVSSDDTLPNILTLLTEYQGVLDRHESMACNLGARPLGPILIRRFERLFEAPPRVLKSHGKEGTTITWLDVVEFAKNKPEQFTLGQMSEGVRVCQFYTRQCRVQISEEDFVLISSGIPQKLIPPQPIVEDEEKELGTIEILEKNLSQICQLADQVAARTRQLNHRLKGRKQAILDRRATDTPAAIRASSPSNVALMNGIAPTPTSAALAGLAPNSQSPSSGFVAVNSRPSDPNGSESSHRHRGSKSAASPSTRSELLAKFHTMADKRSANGNMGGEAYPRVRPSSSSNQRHPYSENRTDYRPKPPTTASSASTSVVDPRTSYEAERTTAGEAQRMLSSFSPVPIPGTPASLLPPHHAAHAARGGVTVDKDDGGPFRAEMVKRMEEMVKGERIIPPCDRCRRLHMDCLKNLTACMGCTKKHAKCSWKEVRPNELIQSGFHEGDHAVMRPSGSERERSEGSVGSAASVGDARSQLRAAVAGGALQVPQSETRLPERPPCDHAHDGQLSPRTPVPHVARPVLSAPGTPATTGEAHAARMTTSNGDERPPQESRSMLPGRPDSQAMTA